MYERACRRTRRASAAQTDHHAGISGNELIAMPFESSNPPIAIDFATSRPLRLRAGIARAAPPADRCGSLRRAAESDPDSIQNREPDVRPANSPSKRRDQLPAEIGNAGNRRQTGAIMPLCSFFRTGGYLSGGVASPWQFGNPDGRCKPPRRPRGLSHPFRPDRAAAAFDSQKLRRLVSLAPFLRVGMLEASISPPPFRRGSRSGADGTAHQSRSAHMYAVWDPRAPFAEPRRAPSAERAGVSLVFRVLAKSPIDSPSILRQILGRAFRPAARPSSSRE